MGCPFLPALPLTLSFSFGLSRHFASERNPNQRDVSGDILAQFPKIPNCYLIMIQANRHTYMINIWRADSGGRKALELITYGLSGQFRCFDETCPNNLQTAKWRHGDNGGLCNGCVHLHEWFHLPTTFGLYSLCRFILRTQVYVVNDCSVCASKSEFTILHCYCKIWQPNALYFSKCQKRLQWT